MSTLLTNPVWQYACGIVGGPLVIGSLFTGKFRSASGWLRKIIWLGGLSAFCWGVVGLVHWHYYYELGPAVRVRLVQVKQLSAGAALALLSLMLTATDFWDLCRSRPSPGPKSS